MWNLHYMDDALVRIIISNNNMCYRLVDMFSKTPKLACSKYYNLYGRVKSARSNSFGLLRFLWSDAFFQWKIENGKSLPSSSAPLPSSSALLPSSLAPLSSSSAEGWRSSLLRKTSWVPELRSRTTSAILQCLFTSIPQESPHPDLPRVGEGGMCYTSKPLYIHTSIITPHPAFGHLLPQGAKEKTLAAQLPSCLAAFNGGVHD